MTSPEDDGLEEELRRALSEAADAVEPGSDGLDKIRDRIGNRPPRPWLLSVLFGVVERVRYWTWRGHWAWTARLPKLPGRWEQRSRRSKFPRWGIGSLRLGVVLGGITVIAVIMLGVQPFRQAIIQASAALNGSSPSQQVSAGTEGNGTGTIAGGSSTPTVDGAASGGPTSPGTAPAATPKPGTTKARQASATACASTQPPVVAATPSLTDTASGVSGTATATEAADSSTSSPATPASTGVAQPVDPSTTSTCSVTPAKSPTPSSSPTPAPAVSSPTPAYTDPTPWSTPTDYPSSPGYHRPGPPGPPSRSWPYGPQDKPWYWHGGPRRR
jgi:hypothetical protein